MAIIIKKDIIKQTLATPTQNGTRLLEPLKSMSIENTMPFNILDEQASRGDVEVHTIDNDLWYCIEGETTFLCGGEMIHPIMRKNQDGTDNEHELKGDDIKNGETIVIRAGDWLWIPAGEPHYHITEKCVRIAIIKIPVHKK